MTGDVPPLVAALVALLAVGGAAFALVGSIGLLRFASFYERVHPPTMGTTLGVGCLSMASVLLFSAMESRLAPQPVLILVFAIVTTPVTYMLLMRAALRRDRARREEEGGAA